MSGIYAYLELAAWRLHLGTRGANLDPDVGEPPVAPASAVNKPRPSRSRPPPSRPKA
jgi:hypothetical protein